VNSVGPSRILHGVPPAPVIPLPEPSYLPRVRVRRALTANALRTLRSIGAFSYAADSPRRRNSLLILCYHGIALQDEHLCWPHLFITAKQFRERLRSLQQQGASVLPLEEALARLQSGSLPPRSVVLTFDDGFCDYLEHAVPVLAEFNFPCTLYLTTHYCDHRLPIINLVLDYVIWKSGNTSVSLPRYGLKQNLPSTSFEQRQAIVKYLLNYAQRRGMDTSSKDELAREVAEDLGVNYGKIIEQRILQILSPDEVRQTAKAGTDIQLHTHRHRVPKNQVLFTREIEDNRRRIIDLTGKTPEHFCYPSGVYSPEFFEWLRTCGVKSATTCESGLAFRNSAPMRLPRVLDDSGMNALRFESVVSGLFV